MNILAIILGIIILLYCINGCRKGLIDGINHIIAFALGILVISILIKGIGNFIQKSYLNVLIALILLVVIRIINRILKLIVDSLELASKLPIVNAANHVFGIAIGFIRALCFCWIIFILIGYVGVPFVNEWIQAQVSQNIFVSVIYKTNIFVRLLLMIQ